MRNNWGVIEFTMQNEHCHETDWIYQTVRNQQLRDVDYAASSVESNECFSALHGNVECTSTGKDVPCRWSSYHGVFQLYTLCDKYLTDTISLTHTIEWTACNWINLTITTINQIIYMMILRRKTKREKSIRMRM